MNKKSVFLFIVLSCALAVSSVWIAKYFGKKTTILETHHLKLSQGSYFFPIHISKFTAANQPCLDILLEGRTVSVMLDLGFRGQCRFSSEFMQHIQNKTHCGSMKMYGVHGTERTQNLFTIPQISVGSITFFEPQLHEYNQLFHSDSSLLNDPSELSQPEPGTLGWQLFEQTNLLLDLKHSQIAFCDSLSTLKKHGYKIEKFIKTPLLSKRGLVEFEAKTSDGSLLCMLDTGATWNIINCEIQENLDAQNTLTHQIFKINSHNFGPIEFHPLPIKIPIPVQAILGMEFFENHCVFLDFHENYIYFLKSDCSL